MGLGIVKGGLAGEKGNREREGEQQEQQSNYHTLKMVYTTSFSLFEKSKSKITVLSVWNIFSTWFQELSVKMLEKGGLSLPLQY